MPDNPQWKILKQLAEAVEKGGLGNTPVRTIAISFLSDVHGELADVDFELVDGRKIYGMRVRKNVPDLPSMDELLGLRMPKL